MPEITVTESQRERLDTIQGDIEAAYIDTYGHIETTDVVQYLLDTYTPPEERGSDVAHEQIATADFGALQAVATDVDGVPGSGIDAETMRGELLSSLGVAEFATRLAEVDGVDDPETAGDEKAGVGDADTASDENDAESEDSDDTASDENDAESEDAVSESDGAPEEGEESDAASADDSGSQSGAAAAGDGPGAVLSAANQLLTDHEDKWREGGSDSPYEVDLPDGTTETVRTKDDVRGLLFKHY